MEFIQFGSKAVRMDKIEAVTLYRNEVTVYTATNHYTCYYDTNQTAQNVYHKLLDKLEKEG